MENILVLRIKVERLLQKLSLIYLFILFFDWDNLIHPPAWLSLPCLKQSHPILSNFAISNFWQKQYASTALKWQRIKQESPRTSGTYRRTKNRIRTRKKKSPRAWKRSPQAKSTAIFNPRQPWKRCLGQNALKEHSVRCLDKLQNTPCYLETTWQFSCQKLNKKHTKETKAV